MKGQRLALVALGPLVLAGACTSKPSATPSGSPSPKAIVHALPTFGAGADYHPTIDPANFTAEVDNPWFPLKVGTSLVYTGTKDGEPARDTFTASSRTKVIMGVPCRVVEDRLYLNGRLAEKTSDYYTQDLAGNVWYFGEDTAELDEKGKVSTTEGTWHAGVDGAQPGVFMQADPTLGREFRQEYYKGHAEDQFKVVDLTATVKVPYGDYTEALRTEETTTLEAGVLDNKYYVRGIGQVEEVAVKGPNEKLVLVNVKTS